jgi:hypothetical protein
MKSRYRLAAVTAMALLLSGVAFTQANFKPKLVPGEKWRQSSTMQMRDMKMPAMSTEVCVPKGREIENMGKQDKSCQMFDTRTTGNTFSARMRCFENGETMEARIETTTEGDHSYGKMVTSTRDGEMTMTFDSRRLGTACEFEDWTGYVPPEAPAPPPRQDRCKMLSDELDKYPLNNFAVEMTSRNSDCSNHPVKKKYCDLVNSPRGFHALFRSQQAMSGVTMGDLESASVKPLSRSMESCRLGNGDEAGVQKLKVALYPAAEADGNWDYLLEFGDEAMFQKLTEFAKRECSGRGFTTAASRRYARLCNPYGPALVRGDREAVRQIAANGFDPGPSAPGAAADEGSAGAAGQGTQLPDQPGTEQPSGQPTSAKDKAKDALDAGKKVLRGIFGR